VAVPNNEPVPVPKSIETLAEPWLATVRSNIVSPLKSPTATETGAVPAVKLVAVPKNEPVPVLKSIETLLEPKLVTAKSKMFCSTSIFSIVQVCGLPIVMSPSHSSEKSVHINKLSPKSEPALNPIVLHITGVTGSSSCSVTLYAPGSSSTFVPGVDEPGKLFCDGLLSSITTVKFEG
jgi:hypothetical protein